VVVVETTEGKVGRKNVAQGQTLVCLVVVAVAETGMTVKFQAWQPEEPRVEAMCLAQRFRQLMGG
jgi:hypothetical protein